MKRYFKYILLVVCSCALLAACSGGGGSVGAAGDNWTWVSGSDEIDQQGTYGTKGTAHADNVPGARGVAVSWIDGDGNLWLFGGYGLVDTDDRGFLNDLWRYEPN